MDYHLESLETPVQHFQKHLDILWSHKGPLNGLNGVSQEWH